MYSFSDYNYFNYLTNVKIIDAGAGDDEVAISGNGTASPTSIKGGDGYDKLTINADYPYWSIISGFEEISADGTGVIPDHIGAAGTTLYFNYVNYGHLDFSAESDAQILINGESRNISNRTRDDNIKGGALSDTCLLYTSPSPRD